MLPGDARTRVSPQVNAALEEKLPKLIDAAGRQKVLLIELPTIDTGQCHMPQVTARHRRFAPIGVKSQQSDLCTLPT